MLIDSQAIELQVNAAVKNTAVTDDILKKIISIIDLTSLNDSDDHASIYALCQKAILPYGHVAAVCVYPQFVKQVAQFFLNKPVKIATVVNFPHGNDSLEQVEKMITDAINNGANEIDVVFPYSQFLSGDKHGAHDFVHACKQTCGKNILLKVILETGALKDLSLITEASRCALIAGADFLKTSTGKIAIGATLDAASVMLLVIKEMEVVLKRPLGFKASGGIRTIEQAVQYIALANNIMKTDWVTPKTFRLGASQLLEVVMEKKIIK